MQRYARRRRLTAAVKHGWARFLDATRPRARLGLGRKRPHPIGYVLPLRSAAAAPAPVTGIEIDPVMLTMLAVNRLGPATMRTATNGRRVVVTVPDGEVAEIFRQALMAMQKARITDRLVEIVVASPDSP